MIFAFLFFVSINCEFRCEGKENQIPLYDKPPTLVQKIPNGKLFVVGDPAYNTSQHVVHLYGTDYEQGVALGTLLKDEMSDFFLDTFPEFIDFIVKQMLPKLPSFIIKWIDDFGIEFVLDWIHAITVDFTPEYFYEYIQGMADGSGIDFKVLLRANLMTEFSKAGDFGRCTLLGGWGDATLDGKFLQVRALDFSNIPLYKYPTVTVHHYGTEFPEVSVINLNSAGYVGMITGLSKDHRANRILGLSEKYWDTGEGFWVEHPGAVWNFELFHMMRHATDLEDAIKILTDTERTCSIHVGVGDSIKGEFRLMYYRPENFTVQNWDTQPEFPQHPKMKDLVYLDKYDEPTESYCFSDTLQAYYGKIDAEFLFRTSLPLLQTGDDQVAVYDFSERVFYYSFGYNQNAYEKQFTKFDMNALFDEEY